LVVAAVALLALVGTVWALVWAGLNMFAAIAILLAGTWAAFANGEEPVAEGTIAQSSSLEPAAVVPLRRDPARPQRPSERKAA
jgi:hypothetical protein